MQQLPLSLGQRFSVAEARSLGVSTDRLRRSDLERPFHGMRTLAAPRLEERPEQEHLERALAYATVMRPDTYFTHVTAATLIGLPLPPWLVIDEPLHVGVNEPMRLPRARGIRGHQCVPALSSVRIDEQLGVRLTSPATTWAMLAAMLPDVFDIVAVGDAVVRDWRIEEPLGTLDELVAASTAGRRVGVGRLRLALPEIRTRSASRAESILRLVLTGSGLAEPECNFDVVENGRWLACVDLAYPHAKVAIEYEGEHHMLSPEQWHRDIARYDLLRAAGWIVIRVTKLDLAEGRGALVRRVRDALAAR